MQVEWTLFATLAEAAGGRTVTVETAADPTVGDALDALVAAHPDLDPLVYADGTAADGRRPLRESVNVLRNGEVTDLDAPAGPDDELAAFPPVSGG
jgi:molybdopterin synthase sulfur carrier subunit